MPYHNFGEDRARRKERVLRAIEENPGVELKTLSNVLSLNMRISPAKVVEYVRELEAVNLITVDFAKVFPKTAKPLDNYIPKDSRPDIIEH